MARVEENGEMGTDDGLGPLADGLKVLANEKRLHLLQFLTTPHYIREIATELQIARQSAQAHVDQLLELGLVERVSGRREHGPVTDFVVVPQRLFRIQESFTRLGRLEAERVDEKHLRTEELKTDGPTPSTSPVSRLVVVHGMRIGERAPLTGEGPWMVGRDPGAQLCLDYDPFVSTRHAEVRRDGRGGYELVDLYSRNGTAVDWEPLERGEARALEPGSVIGVGRTLVVFRRAS